MAPPEVSLCYRPMLNSVYGLTLQINVTTLGLTISEHNTNLKTLRDVITNYVITADVTSLTFLQPPRALRQLGRHLFACELICLLQRILSATCDKWNLRQTYYDGKGVLRKSNIIIADESKQFDTKFVSHSTMLERFDSF